MRLLTVDNVSAVGHDVRIDVSLVTHSDNHIRVLPIGHPGNRHHWKLQLTESRPIVGLLSNRIRSQDGGPIISSAGRLSLDLITTYSIGKRLKYCALVMAAILRDLVSCLTNRSSLRVKRCLRGTTRSLSRPLPGFATSRLSRNEPINQSQVL